MSTTDRSANHFNLIRMIAALGVLVSHSFVLATGREEDEPVRRAIGITLGAVAVDTFFICSGFLVMGSLLRHPSLGAFFRARVFRIYPALLIVSALTILVMGSFFSTLPFASFLKTATTWTFAAKNGVMVFGFYPRLPGVFEMNAYRSTVNGSLWSLPYEIRLYFALGGLGWLAGRLQRRDHRASILKGSAAAIALTALLPLLWFEGAWEQQPHALRFLWMFFAGAFLWFAQATWLTRNRLLLGLAALSVSFGTGHAVNAVYALSLPIVILGLAHGRNAALATYNRAGDYSYGTYLLAFPVQQSAMALDPALTAAGLMAVALPCTIVGAMALWHGVESPAMKRGRSVGPGLAG